MGGNHSLVASGLPAMHPKKFERNGIENDVIKNMSTHNGTS